MSNGSTSYNQQQLHCWTVRQTQTTKFVMIPGCSRYDDDGRTAYFISIGSTTTTRVTSDFEHKQCKISSFLMKVRIKFYYNCQCRYKTLKPFNNSLSLSATWTCIFTTIGISTMGGCGWPGGGVACQCHLVKQL